MALELITPSTMVFRRGLTVADADITTTSGATNRAGNALSLSDSVVDIVEGQWVTLDADGNATLVTTPTRLAYCTWAGGERLDVNTLTSVTAVHGMYIAKTDQFRTDTGDVYAPGTDLTVENGLLRPAAAGEPVLAVAEGAASAATTAYPNGQLTFSTITG